MNINIYNDQENIADAITAKIISLSNSKQDIVNIALSGGETPKKIFEVLAQKNNDYNIDWSKIHFWFSDERCVKSCSPESNYGEAKRLLFSYIDIPDQNIHKMYDEIDSKHSALKYVQELKKYIPKTNSIPRFDLIFLGLGSDGHTASLFMGDSAVNTSHLVATVCHPKSYEPRITLTLPIINNAKEICFIVVGEKKAEIIQTLIKKNKTNILYPAQLVSPTNGKIYWHLDVAAASLFLKSKN